MHFKNLFLHQKQNSNYAAKKFDFEHDPCVWYINFKNPIVYASRRTRSASKAYQCHVCKHRAREKMCFVCSNCHLPICKSCHITTPTIEKMANCVTCHQKYYNLQRSTLFCTLVACKYQKLNDFFKLIDDDDNDDKNIDFIKKEEVQDETPTLSSSSSSNPSSDDYKRFINYFDWYCDKANQKRIVGHVWNTYFSFMKCWLITNFLKVISFPVL